MSKNVDNNNKGKRKKVFDTVILVILIVCALAAAVSLVMYHMAAKEYKKTDTLYENTIDEYTIRNGNPNAPWYEMLTVNMSKLQSVNNEIVGWIFFENEEINYPVLRSEDNEKYFRTAYDGTVASAGSIFMEGANTGDFNDLHTIIYSHNMRNLTMFGRLKNYKEENGYFDTHKYFQIITKDKKYRYEVFAYKDVDAEGKFYTIYKPDATDFKKFVEEEIIKDSMIDTNPAITDDSRVISLSTCTANDDRRFVVSAYRVDEKDVDESFVPTNTVVEKYETVNNSKWVYIFGILFIVVDIIVIIWIIIKRNKDKKNSSKKS